MRRIQVLVTCDRCARPFVNKTYDGETPPPVSQTGFVITKDVDGTKSIVVAYAEVCPECTSTIENYVAKLSLKRPEKNAEKAEKAEKPGEVKIAPVAADAPTATPDNGAATAAPVESTL